MKSIFKVNVSNRAAHIAKLDTSLESTPLDLMRARVSSFAEKTQPAFTASLNISPRFGSGDGVLAGSLRRSATTIKNSQSLAL